MHPALSWSGRYLRDVHGLDLSKIGVVLGVNGALKPVVIVATAYLADRLRRRLRTLHVRTPTVTTTRAHPQPLLPPPPCPALRAHPRLTTRATPTASPATVALPCPALHILCSVLHSSVAAPSFGRCAS